MNNIYLIGDIHGRIKSLLTFKNILKFDSTDTIICLGDVGANFFLNKRDAQFKEKLNNLGCQLFMIRGNHEQRPSILANQASINDNWAVTQLFEGSVWVEDKYPNIYYAMDYPNVYNINGYSTLIIPGAYSVDKYYRLANHLTWFEEEQLTEEEMKYGKFMCEKHNNKFDLVLSHTCPSIYMPTDLFLSVVDQSMVDKTMERYLAEIEQNLDYKLWCFGHYHALRVYPQVDNKQMVMLFNKEILDLKEYFKTKDINKSIIRGTI